MPKTITSMMTNIV